MQVIFIFCIKKLCAPLPLPKKILEPPLHGDRVCSGSIALSLTDEPDNFNDLTLSSRLKNIKNVVL